MQEHSFNPDFDPNYSFSNWCLTLPVSNLVASIYAVDTSNSSTSFTSRSDYNAPTQKIDISENFICNEDGTTYRGNNIYEQSGNQLAIHSPIHTFNWSDNCDDAIVGCMDDGRLDPYGLGLPACNYNEQSALYGLLGNTLEGFLSCEYESCTGCMVKTECGDYHSSHNEYVPGAGNSSMWMGTWSQSLYDQYDAPPHPFYCHCNYNPQATRPGWCAPSLEASGHNCHCTDWGIFGEYCYAESCECWCDGHSTPGDMNTFANYLTEMTWNQGGGNQQLGPEHEDITFGISNNTQYHYGTGAVDGDCNDYHYDSACTTICKRHCFEKTKQIYRDMGFTCPIMTGGGGGLAPDKD